MHFDNGDFSGPIGPALTEEMLILHRGTADASTHYVEGPDNPIFEPFDITFSAMITDNNVTTDLLNWIDAMNNAGATQVNANTLESTVSNTMRDGTNRNPALADSNKFCCNVEYFLNGTTDISWQYNGVYLPRNEQTIAEAADGVNVTLRGKCYGTVVRGTAFTAGTDIR